MATEVEHFLVTYNDVHNIIKKAAEKISEFKPDLVIAIGRETLICMRLISLNPVRCRRRVSAQHLLCVVCRDLFSLAQRLLSCACSGLSVLFSSSPVSGGQRLSQRTFLKRPDAHKNVPIYAICLSLYEPVPGVTNEQIGSEVIRTQWLYVTLLTTTQHYYN
jgi:hypothetical protein